MKRRVLESDGVWTVTTGSQTASYHDCPTAAVQISLLHDEIGRLRDIVAKLPSGEACRCDKCQSAREAAEAEKGEE